MQWRWIWVTLLLLAVGRAEARSIAPPDSVTFFPKGPYYIIYAQDSTGLWQIKELLPPDLYLQREAQRIMGKGFYQLGKPTSKATKRVPPRLGLKANGYLNLNLRQTIIEEENPLLPINLRKRSHLLIDPQINMHLRGDYSERLKLDVIYNTEAVQVEQKAKVRLKYEGERYDFIQSLEAGNIRMDSQNPLINSGEQLMGLKGNFRLGPVDLQVVASRQYAEERTIVLQGGQETQQVELRGSDYAYAQHFFLSSFFADRYNAALRSLPAISSEIYIEHIEVWITTSDPTALPPSAEAIEAYQGASITDQHPTTSLFESKGIEVGSALRLPPSAYTLQPILGYISLHSPLTPGQMLAVAYTYWYQGQRYQVGDLQSTDKRCRVALLSEQNKTSQSALWPLMMKNGYSIPRGGAEGNREDLEVALIYKDPTTGLEQAMVERGADKGKSWLELFGWDRADSSGRGGAPDGIFDYLEGITYQPTTSTLFLPYRSPFVDKVADGYPSYKALYTKSQKEAKEERANDLFRIQAKVKRVATQVIGLGQGSLMPGSVKVESASRLLTEGVDYRIDYNAHTLTMIRPTNERIVVTIQERERIRRKEKSLLGAELNWNLLPNLSIGGTFLAYWEKSQRQRLRWGEEPLRNRMWGLHSRYQLESLSATDWINSWSGLALKEPLRLTAEAALAHLHSEYNTRDEEDNTIVIEDFEQGSTYIDLTHPSQWFLGWLPQPSQRGQLAWFTIDPILVRDGEKQQPIHLANDTEQRHHPLTREIKQEELFPKRNTHPLMLQNVPTLNLSFYPKERGPYNPQHPSPVARDMWGSIAHPMEVQDLKSKKYQYIELWILDPFTLDPTSPEGKMVIDLGVIPENLLPDGGISYEGAQEKGATEWGKRAPVSPQIYAFDTSGRSSIEAQDTGLDGVTSAEESLLPIYHLFRDTPDPAADDYRFFLGATWDDKQATILERYKYINGLEGNASGGVIQGVESARSWTPDTEDINKDKVLEREEAYLSYHIPITKTALSGSQVVAERKLSPKERWVKVRIPLHSPSEQKGSQATLQNVQTIRLSLTDFTDEVHLRLTQLRLVATPWSEYRSPIEPEDRRTAHVEILQLSLEEDANRHPIPYLSPPRVQRDGLPNDWSIRAEDEQATGLKINHLSPQQPVAIYQELTLDLRHYQSLSLWTHLESEEALASGDLELFIRVGQDFTHNYYEYRLPLTATPIADYSGLNEELLKQEIWPQKNRVSLLLDLLPRLKESRDHRGRPTNEVYTETDPYNSLATLALLGHPTLGEVTSLLIGVRNRSHHPLSAEIWVNELSAKGAKGLGGTSAQGRLHAELGELASLHLSTQYRQAGFGTAHSDSRKGALTDTYTLSLNSQVELGLLFPKQWHLSAPLRYSLDLLTSQPKYDPYNSDLLNIQHHGATRRQQQSIELPRVAWLDLGGATKNWYSPQNLNLRYQLHTLRGHSPEIRSEITRQAEGEISYAYHTTSKSDIQLNSLWQRWYALKEYPGLGPSLGTLQSRWDWIRGLQIRQKFKTLSIALQSTTRALIREPFEEAYRHDQITHFQLLTKEIVEDIARLGSTQSYRNSLELIYQLPSFSSRYFQPLQGSLSWRSHYQWQKGITHTESQEGNRSENRRELELKAHYNLAALWKADREARLGLLSVQFRHTSGTALPGLLSGGGKAFGLDFYNHRLEPGLPFMLALNNPQKTLERVTRRHLITDNSSQLTPLSYFWRNEIHALFTLTPLKGLQISLTWQNSQQQHTSLLPYKELSTATKRGSLRYSTITHLTTDTDSQHFIAHNTLLDIQHGELPSLLSTLPNWDISYQLTSLFPKWQKHLQSVKLHHAYRGTLEIPNYHYLGSQLEIKSIVASEELTPLIGLELRGKAGWYLEERYNQRRIHTMIQSSHRLLAEVHRELYSALGYQYTFAPLFQSRWQWLRASQQSLQLQLHHTYNYTLLRQHTPSTPEPTTPVALQGLKSHALQISLEYNLSQAISLKGFYEYLQRQPLVTNYNYPYRQTSYGVVLRLQLLGH